MPKTEKKKLEGAYVIPAEIGDNIQTALKKVPIEFIQHIGPVLQYLDRDVYRADVTIEVPVQSVRPKVPTSSPPPPQKAKGDDETSTQEEK